MMPGNEVVPLGSTFIRIVRTGPAWAPMGTNITRNKTVCVTWIG